jgi:hypothetical protein
MLLVATPDAAGKSDKVLRRLNQLLPDDWLLVAAIPSKAVTDKGRRGRTRPLDAIVIAEKTIFVIDLRSYSGLIAVRDKAPFQADGKDIEHKDNKPDGFWANFQQEAYKVKVMMQERFGVDTIRVMPKIVWARSQRFDYGDSGRDEDVTDARTFARVASRRDKASSHPPFAREQLLAIARFLMDDDQLVLDGAEASAQLADEASPDRERRARELVEAEWVQVGGADGKAAALPAADRAVASERRAWRWLWLVGASLLLAAVAALILLPGPSAPGAPSPPPRVAAPALPPGPPEAVAAPPVVAPESPVAPKPDAAASDVTPRASVPAVERRASAGEVRAKRARPARRKAEATAPATSGTSGTISCILPSGDEIRTGYADCRARSGVIYR